VARYGGVAISNVRIPDSSHGDSEDSFVPSMRGKVPFADASRLLGHEVGLVT
jgi:hypothetical protein